MRRLVLVFLKFPEPGRVKTRLARAVGDAEAVAIYRRLVGAVICVLKALEDVGLRVLYDPADRGGEVVAWISALSGDGGAGRLDFAAQGRGGLGDRLRRGFEVAFTEGFEAVAAVGTDCVDLTPETFSRTWALLEEGEGEGGQDVVIGPSEDGGYYLVAMKRLHGALFDGIPWSSDETLGATLGAARAAGLRAALLEPLRDVDELADWEAVAGRMKDEG